jgi:reactive intermediate/imine deaminase
MIRHDQIVYCLRTDLRWKNEKEEEMKPETLKVLVTVALISVSGASLANGNDYQERKHCATANCTPSGRDGKAVLRTDNIYPPIGPYSQMVAYGNLIYFSGFAPLNLAGTAIEGVTIEEQTKRVLDYISAGLESQGLTFDDVLSVTVYMKDLNEFAAMNRIYAGYFRKDPPARATIEAARLPRDAKIEISVIAARR